MNVFCDPASIRMRAWHLVVGPLAVTSAVCINVFVCVVVLAKVVIAEVTFLLFCGSSCFSCRLLADDLDLARLVYRSRYGVLVRNLDIFLLSDIDILCGLIGGS